MCRNSIISASVCYNHYFHLAQFPTSMLEFSRLQNGFSVFMAALWNRACHYIFAVVSFFYLLVHGQMTIIFVVSVGLSVCLFVCAEFFSAVFDPISIKLGHMLYVWVYLCPLEYRGCVTPGGWVTPKKLVF